MASTENKLKIIEILNKYKPLGIVKGGELCLSPKDALNFTADLENAHIGIMGFDGWYFWDRTNQVIAQDLDVDISISEEVLSQDNRVQKSLEVVRDYILSGQLPERIAFISMTLDIPYTWKELFPEQ